ncbi:MAG: hypothetical protein KKD28_06695, partial [Chloroflexi bacterium]|nr:hypothetical protein [Chloroflexota bacterium]
STKIVCLRYPSTSSGQAQPALALGSKRASYLILVPKLFSVGGTDHIGRDGGRTARGLPQSSRINVDRKRTQLVSDGVDF